MVSPVIIPGRKRDKINSSSSSKKKRGLIVILFIFILAIFYFLFYMNGDKTPQHLKGNWLRTDGVYKIEIMEVLPDGKLVAGYFNPNPINVGRAGWRIQEEKLQIYVELQDKNYPGSIYQLTYDIKSETLQGTYYQAVSQQTFEVSFNKIK